MKMISKQKVKQLSILKNNSQLADIWYRLKRNKSAVFGMVVIIIIAFLAIFAGVFADYENDVIQQYPLQRLQPPSWEHIFGTDALGRDMFSRIIFGARYSLVFGLTCSVIGLVFGTLLGTVSAYFGGIVDMLIMRFLDVLISIPGILLTLAMIAVLGNGLDKMIIAMTVGGIAGFTRITRAWVLSIVRQEYIEAARAVGASSLRIIVVHVIPNAMAMIIVSAAMSISGYILAAAGLSFIGMGIQPPAPEWGTMLNESMDYMRLNPYLVVIPGLAILLTSLSFNLFGDGLSEALDPRMKD
jgi:peptide/nickel transport system permease protein